MDQSPSKRVRVGGPDFLESQAGLPDGPANWQQLINLPGELFQVCIAPEFDGGQDAILHHYIIIRLPLIVSLRLKCP